MKIFYFFLLFILFSSCTKNQDIELEIISKEINSLVINPENYGDVMGSEDSLNSKRFKKAKTIITYKVTNKSNTTYFFNIGSYSDELENNAIKMDKAFLVISDDKEGKVKAKNSFPTRGGATADELKFGLLNYDYKYYHENKNFIIHPNETLYFEGFVVLPFGSIINFPVAQIELDSKKEYNAEVLVSSNDDSLSRKFLSRTELRTIKENNYEIFNGILKSKNKVRIKFVK